MGMMLTVSCKGRKIVKMQPSYKIYTGNIITYKGSLLVLSYLYQAANDNKRRECDFCRPLK
jgi:hypothetical protein